MFDPRDYIDLTPRMIAIVYVVFGLLWITTSDVIVFRFFSSSEFISTIQTLKGGLFVALSGGIIWGLTRQRETKIQESRDRQQDMSIRLQVLQRVFRHNIRNELNIVKGFIELALEERRSAELVAASESAANVIEISEKIKVVDRYPIGTEVRESIDLAPVIEEEVRRIRTDHPSVTVETTPPEDGRVRADDSVGVILHELLENAVIHYDEPIETLVIEVSCRVEGNRVLLQVTDNGPGIPSYELRALREGHETPLIHLSSVGLWVVQWLVERLNADIEFETVPEGGTEVTVELRTAGADGAGESDQVSLADGLEFFTQ